MQLVEQHRIDQHDPRWQAIDAAAFGSKHLYNAALYIKRQAYIHEENRIISQSDLDKLMQPTAEYHALPAKVAQWVLKQVCVAWDSYFAACDEWKRHPGKFLGHPRLPKYLDKNGRNLLVYTAQAISRDPKNAGQPGFVPLLVNGRPLKALNQWYNKRRAALQAKLPPGQFTSHQLNVLTDKRKRQMDHYLHVASRQIVEVLVAHHIGTLVIGKNDGWKQHANMGKKTNQSFVFIPHARFIKMLTYKAQVVEITVIVTEESHTSKCSFLDRESIEHHDQYVGKRVKRGLFRTANGRHINADVNGAYNMIVKVVPNAFGNGRAGVVVHPVGLALHNRKHVA